MKPRVLIVGTVPYNKKSTSRAFESYFSGWEKENLAQIFSHSKKPTKGHCQTLFQITDKRMLKRRFSSRVETGIIFNYEELDDEWTNTSLEVGKAFSILYKIGAAHTPLTHLIRKWVWKKKYWLTSKLENWLKKFNPECVFLSFSDDFFVSEIALYVAKKFNIPIVSSIGDDYYFNERFSLSPFYYIYKKRYQKLIQEVFEHKGSAIYIGDKIRDKYNSAFGLNGKTVYLTSEVKRKNFSPINKEAPLICYFGNINMGRNVSLNDIGKALKRINPNYFLQVYSNETNKRVIRKLLKDSNIVFNGSIPYVEVMKKNVEADIVVLVEGFSKKAIDITRYSLSTKAADSLASGSNIFVYGSIDCGLIEYMLQTKGACVCTDPKKLELSLKEFIDDQATQRKNYDNAIITTNQNHVLKNSTAVFSEIVKREIERNKNEIKR